MRHTYEHQQRPAPVSAVHELEREGYGYELLPHRDELYELDPVVQERIKHMSSVEIISQ